MLQYVNVVFVELAYFSIFAVRFCF